MLRCAEELPHPGKRLATLNRYQTWFGTGIRRSLARWHKPRSEKLFQQPNIRLVLQLEPNANAYHRNDREFAPHFRCFARCSEASF